MSLVDLQVSPTKIATLSFNDPERLNAMSLQMAKDFAARIVELEDHAPRMIILRGAGRSFSAGGDLQMLDDKSRQSARQNERQMIEFYSSFLDILDLNVPIIAALQGYVVGAGFCLACACDLRVAEEGTVFAAPFLHMGLFPGMGATLSLPRALGNLGVELLLSGRRMKAEEAHRAGFLSRLVGLGLATQEAEALAHDLLRSAPNVTKQLLEILRPTRRERLVFLEREAKLQGQSYLEEEFRLGLAAAKVKGPSPFAPPEA